MSLIPFLNRHAGETAWLFGKGPSLSTFNFSTAGPLRAAINDAISHIPDCVYGFANDGISLYRNDYKECQTLFQPVRCLHEYEGGPIGTSCKVVLFEDAIDDNRLFMPRETLAGGLCVRRNTVGTALQILHVMGISTAHLVGFDGGDQYAPGFNWKSSPIPKGDREYDAARSEAIDAACIMGMTVKIDNQPMTPEGKTFVRITRDTLAEQIHYSPGQIVSLDPKIANELIAANVAELFQDQIETAESRKHKQAETAELKSKRSTK